MVAPKKWSLRAAALVAAALSILLAGCGLSLAEDVTPPPNYRAPTAPPEQPVELKTVFPIVPPDPAQGEAIYAEKCAPCHGVTGMGDGAQSGNLPNPAAPIGDPELARASRPVDWYAIVTQGNLERFMPGFTQSLNDRQRWDVVAYALTLSTSPEELARGQALYDENCAACHGASGKGDGERAAGLQTQPAAWTDQSKLAALSAEDLVEWMRSGKGEMHPFAEVIDEAQAYAVAAYIRTLSYAAPGLPVAQAEATPTTEGTEEAGTPAATRPAGTPEAGTPAAGETAQPLEKIDISGKVVNGTPGGKVPAGLKATLLAYQEMTPAFEMETDVADDGSYAFADVEYASNYVYFVRVAVGELFFTSDILHGQDVQGSLSDVPVTIYETTSDAAALQTDRLHVFFDFSTPGKVQVVNLFIISNPSGKVVVAPGEGKPVVEYELPQGAENLQFQDGVLGERYVKTEKGFGDTSAISPGQGGMNQVLFGYELPYTGGLDLAIKLPMPVQAASVMVPELGVELQSERLADAGQRDVEGLSYHMYQSTGGLAAGDSIPITLKGKPGDAGSTGITGNTPLLIGAGVFGLVLLGAGVWLASQRAKSADTTVEEEEEAVDEDTGPAGETSESLLDAIVALDDQHASGSLPEDAYQKRRAQLKARLAEALEREKKQP